MAGKTLLVLKEQPSFEGELSISLNEERDPSGCEKYFVVCQKKPPLSAIESAIFAAALNRVARRDLEEIAKSMDWQCEVPLSEARKIINSLENLVVPVGPESAHGLDGTTYELVVERGFNKIQFSWWCEPPAAWGTLRELSGMLLDLAQATSRIESLQSINRKNLIQQLLGELEEESTRQDEARMEFVRTSNSRCHELAERLHEAGLKCPNCAVVSSDVRFVDKSPAGRSYFICKACGRSFRPEDL